MKVVKDEVELCLNENCLKGRRCPMCGQSERFIITALADFPLTDDGTDFPAGSVEYDEDSPARCPCGFVGKWRQFNTKGVRT